MGRKKDKRRKILKTIKNLQSLIKFYLVKKQISKNINQKLYKRL